MNRVLLQGTLDKLRIASLLQALLSDGIEGTLEVTLTGSIGWLTLHGQGLGDGALGRLVGADAAIGLLMPQSGSFVLYAELKSSARTILEDPLALMLESLRLFDLWTALQRRRFQGASRLLGEGALAHMLDLGQTPEQVAQALSLHPLEVLQQLGPLVASLPGVPESAHAGLRVVTSTEALSAAPVHPSVPIPEVLASAPGPAQASAATPVPSASCFELLDAARAAFRTGQLEEAEALFLQARDLDPENRTVQQNLRVLQLKKRMQAEEAISIPYRERLWRAPTP